MRTKVFGYSIIILALAGSPLAGAQEQTTAIGGIPAALRSADGDNPAVAKSPTSATILEYEKTVDQIIARENDEMAALALYTPIVETYIQAVKPSITMGVVPKSDFYFLGQADFKKRTKLHSMLEHRGPGSLFRSVDPFATLFDPEGFINPIFLDRYNFNKQTYRFEYIGRAFLGDIRCLVFNMEPLPKVRGTRFVGRIWVEDRDYSIVRANGTYLPSSHFSWKTASVDSFLHFDCWRTNVKSGLWLPSYIYSEQMGHHSIDRRQALKAQTRIWGYNLKPVFHEEEFSKLIIESPMAVNEDAVQHDRSPLEAQREWRSEAERNTLEVLERDGLLAPPGPIDKVLDTIVNNLEITSKLELDLHCRVLLTSTLEMFSVGNAVIMSRGLIDVIPDEATMAAILAPEVANAMVPKAYQDEYAFSDVTRLPSTEVLKTMSFEDAKTDVLHSNEKALEILRNSPYVNQLSTAGLFLKQLTSQSKALKQLISPRLGNRVFLASQLADSAPRLEIENKTQVAALPMGARIKLDPWNDNIVFMKTKAVPILSGRDKMPFELTPLMPYITRYEDASVSVKEGSSTVSKN